MLDIRWIPDTRGRDMLLLNLLNIPLVPNQQTRLLRRVLNIILYQHHILPHGEQTVVHHSLIT